MAIRSRRSWACRKWIAAWIASASKRAATARTQAKEAPATVLNSLMTITRAGGAIGIPGLYVTDDPGGIDAAAKIGNLSIRIGLGWAKSHYFTTGQCPVMKYNRQLMMAILHDKIQIAKAVNVTVITLDEGAAGLQGLRQGRRQEVRDRSARSGGEGEVATRHAAWGSVPAACC